MTGADRIAPNRQPSPYHVSGERTYSHSSPARRRPAGAWPASADRSCLAVEYRVVVVAFRALEVIEGEAGCVRAHLQYLVATPFQAV